MKRKISKIDEIDFSKIDYSKYQNDIEELAKLIKKIKNDKWLRMILKRYQKTKKRKGTNISEIKIVYNKRESKDYKEIRKYSENNEILLSNEKLNTKIDENFIFPSTTQFS